MDAERRRLERRLDDPESKARHIVSLLRSGEIDRFDVELAAAFGNPIARQVAQQIGVAPPVIASADDILSNLAVTRNDLKFILYALKNTVPSNLREPRESIAWALGWAIHSKAEWFQLREVAQTAIEEVINSIGLEEVLQILKSAVVPMPLQ